jgi:hypothetical protein
VTAAVALPASFSIGADRRGQIAAPRALVIASPVPGLRRDVARPVTREDCVEMTEIAWRVFHAGNPGTPIVGPPPTRENARLYGRSILDTCFAGPPGPNAWHAPFGGDVAAAGRGADMTRAQRLPGVCAASVGFEHPGGACAASMVLHYDLCGQGIAGSVWHDPRIITHAAAGVTRRSSVTGVPQIPEPHVGRDQALCVSSAIAGRARPFVH